MTPINPAALRDLAERCIDIKKPTLSDYDARLLARAVIALLDELDRIKRVHAGQVTYGSDEHQEMYTPLAMRLMGERDAAVAERDEARRECDRLRAVATDIESQRRASAQVVLDVQLVVDALELYLRMPTVGIALIESTIADYRKNAQVPR